MSLLVYVLLQGKTDRDVHDAVELRVADCMRGSGWQYEPVPYEAVVSGPALGATWAETREYRLTHGYGATQDAERPATDPNSEYLRTLTSSQSAAFYALLVGDDFDEISPDSCLGKAEARVRAGIPYYDPPTHTSRSSSSTSFSPIPG